MINIFLYFICIFSDYILCCITQNKHTWNVFISVRNKSFVKKKKLEFNFVFNFTCSNRTIDE